MRRFEQAAIGADDDDVAVGDVQLQIARIADIPHPYARGCVDGDFRLQLAIEQHKLTLTAVHPIHHGVVGYLALLVEAQIAEQPVLLRPIGHRVLAAFYDKCAR